MPIGVCGEAAEMPGARLFPVPNHSTKRIREQDNGSRKCDEVGWDANRACGFLYLNNKFEHFCFGIVQLFPRDRLSSDHHFQ